MRSRPASFLLLILPVISSLTMVSLAGARNSGFLPNHADRETTQKLVLDLQSQSKNDQIRAAQALGEMGPAAQEAVPAAYRGFQRPGGWFAGGEAAPEDPP